MLLLHNHNKIAFTCDTKRYQRKYVDFSCILICVFRFSFSGHQLIKSQTLINETRNSINNPIVFYLFCSIEIEKSKRWTRKRKR